MEIVKKTQQTLVERLSQNATVQAIQAKNFAQASRELPTRINKSFDVPKIWEMSKVAGAQTVSGFIEFELIRLAEQINVSGNLTDGQIQSIANHLVNTYPNETIADFKICFQRAANGVYGKIFKLDGIEIGVWVQSFLDEKYKVLEDELMKEKEKYHNEAMKPDADWLKLWQEAIDQCDEDGGVKTMSRNLHQLNYLRGMTDKEIKEEGKEKKPATKNYPITSKSELIKRELHFQWISENHDPRTGDKLENWIPEYQWLELNR